MEPIRKEDVEREHDTEPDDIRRVLQNIAADARALKHRYLDDTIVPEGGE
jgi:hypothetical protein